jgi:hypothetical protein
MFALGAAVLMLEVLLTRVAAVTLFANLAFAVIALSLFGLAVGSAWAQTDSSASEEDQERQIRTSLLVAGAAALLAAILATKLPLVPDELSFQGHSATTFSQRRSAFNLDPLQIHWALIALLVVVQGVPFAMAGFAQARLLARAGHSVSLLYAVDLAGATLGALGALVALRHFGAANGVAFVAVLFVLSALIDGGAPSRSVLAGAGGVVALGIALLVAFPLDIKHAAGFSETNVVAVDWSALARVGLYIGVYRGHGGTGSLDESTLVVDNTSASEVAFAHDARFSENLERIPYLLRPDGDVLVIGAGGGQEIETALATAPGRQRRVDAVELADGEERLMRRFFGKRSDFLLDQPGVHYTIGDGRSFIEIATRRWDVIGMKEVNFHSFAGQAASAWSPSLLFTTEAVRTEIEHLTPEGLLAINRGMYFGGEMASTLQLISTIRSAAEQLGVELGPRLLLVDRPRPSGFQRLFVVAARPFTDAELDLALRTAEAQGLVVRRSPRTLYPPVEELVTAPYREALAHIRSDRGLLVEPTTDDHPFGQQQLPFLSALLGRDETAGVADLQRADARILTASAMLLLVLTAALIRSGTRKVKADVYFRALGQLAICALLGVGFMLLEVVLVERTSILLGHPTVAFVAVVTSMLCGLGVGSLLSGRFQPEGTTARSVVVGLLAVLVVEILAVSPVGAVSSVRAIGPALRPWIVGAALFLGAVPLGALLPSVIRLSIGFRAASTAACWSTNAAGSVLGTIAAALMVRTLGFSATGRTALCLYGLAVVLWLVQRRTVRGEPGVTGVGRASE